MFDKYAKYEKEMLGEHGSLGLTGPDESESDMIGDAGIIQGVELETGRTCWTDRNGRKLCFEVRRRLSWRVWVLFAAVVAALIVWGVKSI